MRPNMNGILESSLYVSDVSRSAHFYEELFGFPVIADFGERGCAMRAGPQQVLLLFKKGASRAIQSPHDGDGELHVAFARRVVENQVHIFRTVHPLQVPRFGQRRLEHPQLLDETRGAHLLIDGA